MVSLSEADPSDITMLAFWRKWFHVAGGLSVKEATCVGFHCATKKKLQTLLNEKHRQGVAAGCVPHRVLETGVLRGR